MFNRLYLGEIKKLTRPKSLIALSVVMIIFLVLFAIGYNFMVEMESEDLNMAMESEHLTVGVGIDNEEMSEEDFDIYPMLYGNEFNLRIYNKEQIDELIDEEKSRLKEIEEYMKDNDFATNLNFDFAYEVKGTIKALEYIKANKLYNEPIEIHSPTAIFSQRSAEGFAQGFNSLLLTIIIIYGIVIGAGSFSAEMHNGTLKMLFMRPITRNKLTTAKILALFTMITAILLGGTLVSYLYGLIRYGAAPITKGLIVFNAMSVFEGSRGLLFFMNIMFGLLQAFALCLFAFAFGTVTKNRVLAIITCVLTSMGLVASILSLFKIGKFLFSTNANLGAYFGVTSAVPAGANFFIALPLFVAYVSIFLVTTYLVFNKRDIT